MATKSKKIPYTKSYIKYRTLAIEANKLLPEDKKLNFNIDGREHYVYRVTDYTRNIKEHYYGSRTPPKSKKYKSLIEEFWTYRTSSKKNVLNEDAKDNYKVKILKVFNNTADKMIYEAFLHQYFDVKKSNSFWNESNQTPFGFDTTGVSSCNKGIMYNVFDNSDNIIHKKLSISQITKINQGLTNTCYTKRLGNTVTQKISLNYNKKLHMIGYYIKSIGVDDTKDRVDFTIHKGRVYKPVSKEQIEKTKQTMSLKTDDEIKIINTKKGIKNKGKKHSEETKIKCSLSKMGELNYRTRSINIYDNNNTLMYNSKISFQKYCNENNLPFAALNRSLKNNDICYSSKFGYREAKKHNNTKYIGWYARYEKNNI